MPITTKDIRFLSFIKSEAHLKIFLESAKDIQNSKGFISDKDIKNLAVKCGIPDSSALSILSFYEMFIFKKTDKLTVCNGPGCTHKDIKVKNINYTNCLGLCDITNPAIYHNKQVSVSGDKISEIGSVKILNSNTSELYLLRPRAKDYYVDRLNDFFKMSSETLIDKILSSNLRGRGGAGFSTGKKLISTRNSTGDKVLICNFDESEPFVFKDRGIVEHNPFSVVSGMIIAAKIIGAKDIFIYIRGEYIKQKSIIKQAVLFMEKIFRDYNFSVISGAGAYICGEETALMESIEGKRGHPRKKPPFPFESGLFKQSTAVLNVETLGWIFEIIDNNFTNADRRIFCVTGDVFKKGVFESGEEISINEIVKKYAGGFINDSKEYFALIGGASGFFVKKENFDITLKELFKDKNGAGSLFIFQGKDKLRDVMLYILKFFSHESCGQCNPCFMGYNKLYHLVENNNFHEALKLSKSMANSTLCGLGRAGGSPLLTYCNIKCGE